jgi:hypothetical protein
MKRLADILKNKRGRRRTAGRSEGILLRAHAPMLSALDACIETQPDKLTRAKAIRRIVSAHLRDKGYLA